jgi:hypothetical protein
MKIQVKLNSLTGVYQYASTYDVVELKTSFSFTFSKITTIQGVVGRFLSFSILVVVQQSTKNINNFPRVLSREVMD